MRDTLNSLLLMTPWFMMIKRNDEQPPEMRFNWSDFIRTMVVAALVGVASSVVTVEVLKVRMDTMSESVTEIKLNYKDLCVKFGQMSEIVAIMKVRQDDRLERERETLLRGMKR
jgi:hypothetical protein